MYSRKEVYAAIDTEREYQNHLWEKEACQNKHSVAEFVLYLEDYVAEARKQLARGTEPAAAAEALNTLRKVAGLAVACMEQHGAPVRDIHDLLTAQERHPHLR